MTSTSRSPEREDRCSGWASSLYHGTPRPTVARALCSAVTCPCSAVPSTDTSSPHTAHSRPVVVGDCIGTSAVPRMYRSCGPSQVRGGHRLCFTPLLSTPSHHQPNASLVRGGRSCVVGALVYISFLHRAWCSARVEWPASTLRLRRAGLVESAMVASSSRGSGRGHRIIHRPTGT